MTASAADWQGEDGPCADVPGPSRSAKMHTGRARMGNLVILLSSEFILQLQERLQLLPT
jgi:hypothetical protein